MTKPKLESLDTFIHVSDFGAAGYSRIPGIAALTGRATVWAPSGAFIKKNHGRNLHYGISDILDWINAGIVQVAAREEWIFSRKSRETGHWHLTPWTDGFDNELEKLAKADASIPDIRARRVIALKKGSGQEFAKKAIDSPNAELIQRVEAAIQNKKISEELVRKAEIGKKFEKNATVPTEEYLKYFILSSARNHLEAQSDLNAPIALSPGMMIPLFQYLLQDERLLSQSHASDQASASIKNAWDFMSSEYVEEIIEFVHYMLKITNNPAALEAFSHKPARTNFLRELVLNPNLPPLLRLESELSESVQNLEFKSYWSYGSRPGWTEFLSSFEALQSAFRLVTGSVGAILRAPELKIWRTLGIAPEKRYKGHWIFLLMGKRGARLSDMQKAHELICKFREERKNILGR